MKAKTCPKEYPKERHKGHKGNFCNHFLNRKLK